MEWTHQETAGSISEKKSEQHKTAWDSLSQKNRIQYLQQKSQIMRTAHRSAACGKNDYIKLPNPQIQLYLAFYLPGEGEGGSGKRGGGKY